MCRLGPAAAVSLRDTGQSPATADLLQAECITHVSLVPSPKTLCTIRLWAAGGARSLTRLPALVTDTHVGLVPLHKAGLWRREAQGTGSMVPSPRSLCRQSASKRCLRWGGAGGGLLPPCLLGPPRRQASRALVAGHVDTGGPQQRAAFLSFSGCLCFDLCTDPRWRAQLPCVPSSALGLSAPNSA